MRSPIAVGWVSFCQPSITFLWQYNQKPDCTLSCNRGCDREAKMRGRSLPFTRPQTRRFSNAIS
ncbi:hypothetical protein [Nostoc sp. FACHB-133]|uniref:hypothetical protein n=1 Tax=Nostoc sp. FACHB-133 TaxID=2692835 RepID=UPI0016875136|nr:hypothetical protein [Nostoc sp. FACHB-133]MBD2522779.1 hypothetical protein [Nostoc sp. FACHB-133]